MVERRIGEDVFDDPDLPRFNYSREVDYVSGVCLMIEAERFSEVGGFDDDFAPAYCEDVDLCLRLRQKGLRIVYQPSATVVQPARRKALASVRRLLLTSSS